MMRIGPPLLLEQRAISRRTLVIRRWPCERCQRSTGNRMSTACQHISPGSISTISAVLNRQSSGNAIRLRCTRHAIGILKSTSWQGGSDC
eukprot:3521295-Pleurochrysis_carterae.AAC.1